MTRSDAIAAVRFRYGDDPHIEIGSNPYEDAWECDEGYMVRAWITVPYDHEGEDDAG